ncbi:unnamed protein product [Heligmosomoides polygyrus]|uniref:Secreted protein n=1 Tax=Heligmosomoides polygyrus TaxID=6339 RepID=A0A183FL34_HELPZ|nr:unnamed protein product [Heligmosomoides polygyrus]
MISLFRATAVGPNMSAPFGGENEVMLKRECTSQINGTKCASNEAKTRVGRASDILYEHSIHSSGALVEHDDDDLFFFFVFFGSSKSSSGFSPPAGTTASSWRHGTPRPH